MVEKIVPLRERCQYFSLEVPSQSVWGEPIWAGGFLLDRFMAAYILASGESVLFIDSGWDNDLAAYMLNEALELLAQVGLKASRYFLLNTHSDWDHAWANRAFKQRLGSRLQIASSLETFLAMRQDLHSYEVERRQKGAEASYFATSSIELPNLLWADREKLFLGRLEVRFIKVSAHCPGQLTLWLPQLKILFAADSCEAPLPFPQNELSLAEQLANFKYLLSLGAKQVWPAHHLAWSEHLPASPGAAGQPELLLANYNYYQQLEANCLAYASASLKAECSAWLASKRAQLSALLNNEEAWTKPRTLAQAELLAQLQGWEERYHIDIAYLAKQTGQDCSPLFYQRAHHLAALMYLEKYFG